MYFALENSNGGLALPSGKLGSGLYDFGYNTGVLPPSGAAKTAAQVESGGSATGWFSDTLRDITDAWVTVQQVKAANQAQAQAPVQWRRSEGGDLYVTDPAYRASTVGGVPTTMLLGGAALLVLVVLLVKD